MLTVNAVQSRKVKGKNTNSVNEACFLLIIVVSRLDIQSNYIERHTNSNAILNTGYNI